VLDVWYAAWPIVGIVATLALWGLATDGALGLPSPNSSLFSGLVAFIVLPMFLWTGVVALAAAWALGWRWRVLALLLGIYLLPPVVPTAFWFMVWRKKRGGSPAGASGPGDSTRQTTPSESVPADGSRLRPALLALCGGFLLVAHAILLLNMAASLIGLIACLVLRPGEAVLGWAGEHLGVYYGFAVVAALILSAVLAARVALYPFHGRGRVRFISDEEVLLTFLLLVPWVGYLCWRSIVGRASSAPSARGVDGAYPPESSDAGQR
jgi:hypothetical protein